MTADTAPPGTRRPAWSDIVIGSGLAVLFAVALVQTLDWSFRTALFPRFVGVLGLVFTLCFLVLQAVAHRRAGREPVGVHPSATSPTHGDASSPPVAEAAAGAALPAADVDDDQDVEYVYATAGRRAWMQALAWIGLYLVLLVSGGLFVAAAAFALCYLRWGAGRGWTFAVIYAAVLSLSLYGLLDYLLSIPTPPSLLW